MAAVAGELVTYHEPASEYARLQPHRGVHQPDRPRQRCRAGQASQLEGEGIEIARRLPLTTPRGGSNPAGEQVIVVGQFHRRQQSEGFTWGSMREGV